MIKIVIIIFPIIFLGWYFRQLSNHHQSPLSHRVLSQYFWCQNPLKLAASIPIWFFLASIDFYTYKNHSLTSILSRKSVPLIVTHQYPVYSMKQSPWNHYIIVDCWSYRMITHSTLMIFPLLSGFIPFPFIHPLLYVISYAHALNPNYTSLIYAYMLFISTMYPWYTSVVIVLNKKTQCFLLWTNIVENPPFTLWLFNIAMV